MLRNEQCEQCLLVWMRPKTCMLLNEECEQCLLVWMRPKTCMVLNETVSAPLEMRSGEKRTQVGNSRRAP